MEIAFAILAALTLVSGIAAMTMRHVVHCALCLAVTFAGLAAVYLQLGAQFVGFAQILVYVGAVAILVVFAILLTRSGEGQKEDASSRFRLKGGGIALLVFGVLTWVILHSSLARREAPAVPELTVRELGNQLMTYYVLPLEVMGLLLTAATIGAVIIALREPTKQEPNGEGRPEGPTLNGAAEEPSNRVKELAHH